MGEFTKITVASQVGRVVLARPELHNAFNETVMKEITEAVGELGGRKDVRTIVLAAEGKSFCAGADARWMQRMAGFSFEENVADASILAGMLRTIRECPKPVIARVHGAAIGGGVGLVAACDLAVAIESAIFSLSEVKLGIVPAVISPFVMEKIGLGTMRRYALTAERFDAREALRIGLINELSATESEMDAWIGRICESVAANGPEAVAACKQILTEVSGFAWDQAQVRTTERIAEIRVSAEGQEGLKAFLEKRPPNWVTGAR